jgi:hypothetical protein
MASTESELHEADDRLRDFKEGTDRGPRSADPHITRDGTVYRYDDQLDEWEVLGNLLD